MNDSTNTELFDSSGYDEEVTDILQLSSRETETEEENVFSENEEIESNSENTEVSSNDLSENAEETIYESITYDFNSDLSDIKNIFSIQIFLILGFFVAVAFIKGFDK